MLLTLSVSGWLTLDSSSIIELLKHEHNKLHDNVINKNTHGYTQLGILNAHPSYTYNGTLINNSITADSAHESKDMLIITLC